MKHFRFRLARFLFTPFSLLLLGLPPSGASAAVDRWSSLGPGGGASILAVAIDPRSPTTVYAAPYGAGVFKSTDGGAQWKPARAGLTETIVSALVVDPETPATLYAATSGGVFKSTNSAESWLLASRGLPPGAIGSLAISRQSPPVLWAATSAGLYKTGNRASDWSPVSSPITRVKSLAVDPINGETVYAAAAIGVGTDPHFFRSTDGGANWSLLGRGAENVEFNAIVIDPARPSTLYASASAVRGPGPPGVYKSIDGGATWVPVNNGLGIFPFAFAVVLDPSSTQAKLYAVTSSSLFQSTDGAASWTRFNPGFPDGWNLAIDASSGALYVGNYSGLWKLSPGGSSWTPLDRGMEPYVITSFAVDPLSPSTLYAASYRGVINCTTVVSRTDDRGQSWSDTNVPGNCLSRPRLARGLLEPGTLFVGTSAGTFKSTDGARTFSATSLTRPTRAVAADPTFPRVLYAGTDDGLYKTTDGGATWTRVLEQAAGILSVAVAPSDPSTVYAGGGARILRSQDGGTTWTLTGSLRYATRVSALAVDPRSASTVYAGGDDPDLFGGVGSLYKTTDAGDHWEYSLNADVRSIAIDPVRPWIVYVGTIAQVFRSFNAGLFWDDFDEGLPYESVEALAVDASGPTTIYAGTPTGVFQLALRDKTGCAASGSVLCLDSNRFDVRVTWQLSHVLARGQAMPATSGVGYFWFLSPGNVELAVKVLDGRSINGKFWVFLGSLTNLRYVVTITDTQTGAVRTYENPQGRLASTADTSAFDGGASGPSGTPALGAPSSSTTAAGRPCESGNPCLNGERFEVQVQWNAPAIGQGSGHGERITSDSASFWFFGAGNPEVIVKVLDGRAVNGRFWVFVGSLTNVEYAVTVRDTQTGATRSYFNPLGTVSSIADIEAF